MTNWFYISSAFCCQFSSTENHSALQQTTLQLIQMSMLALLAFTKTTFFAWLDPKWAFGLLAIAPITQRQTTLHFILVFLLSLATFGKARKIGFWQSKCTLGPEHTLTHMLPLEKLKNEQTFSNYEASTPPTITSCKEYIVLKINCSYTTLGNNQK